MRMLTVLAMIGSGISGLATIAEAFSRKRSASDFSVFFHLV